VIAQNDTESCRFAGWDWAATNIGLAARQLEPAVNVFSLTAEQRKRLVAQERD
jgi:hypothetical protein